MRPDAIFFLIAELLQRGRPAIAAVEELRVGEALGAIDDKFVIFGGGDELTLRFTPPATTPPDITRRYLFLSDGFYKDLKENVSHTVAPLPFAAMSNFPYPDTESYPTDADHQAYLSDWNTRYESSF